MNTLFIIFTIITIFIIPYISYKYYKKSHENKSIRLKNIEKINYIINNINKIVNKRSGYIYYSYLKSTIDNLISISNSYKNKRNTDKILIDVDNIYCDLKRDLRVMDEYIEFREKFQYRKRKYRMVFKNSINILNLLEDKYSKEVVNKYLINFDIDFANFKINEINKLDRILKNCEKFYDNFSTKELTVIFNEVKYIDCEILTKLDEPNRLRDKFILSEDNIDQLESEISNTKGSLYFKVFNTIKYNKINKENSDEWNIIKRNINGFRKNKLLKLDVIELNDKLNTIIKDLTSLSNIITENIKKHEQEVKELIN